MANNFEQMDTVKRDDNIDCDIMISNIPNINGIYKRLLEELTCDFDLFGPIELLQLLKDTNARIPTQTTCGFLRYYDRQQHQRICNHYNNIPAELEGRRLYFTINNKTITQLNEKKSSGTDRLPSVSRVFSLKWGTDRETQTDECDLKDKQLSSNEVNVLCINCMKEIGYDIYPRHIKFCTNYKVCCTHCQVLVNYSTKDQHEQVCEQGLVKCNYCDCEFTNKIVKSHEEECGNVQKMCNLCLRTFRRKNLRGHDCRMIEDRSFLSAVAQSRCPICLEDFRFIKENELYNTMCGHVCCKACLINLGFRSVTGIGRIGFQMRTSIRCPVCGTLVRDDPVNVVRLYFSY